MEKEEVQEKVSSLVTWATNFHDRMERINFKIGKGAEADALIAQIDQLRNALLQAEHALDVAEAAL